MEFNFRNQQNGKFSPQAIFILIFLLISPFSPLIIIALIVYGVIKASKAMKNVSTNTPSNDNPFGAFNNMAQNVAKKFDEGQVEDFSNSSYSLQQEKFATTQSGNYQVKKPKEVTRVGQYTAHDNERAAALRDLLKAGIIERDEYNERMAELSTTKWL